MQKALVNSLQSLTIFNKKPTQTGHRHFSKIYAQGRETRFINGLAATSLDKIAKITGTGSPARPTKMVFSGGMGRRARPKNFFPGEAEPLDIDTQEKNQ